MAQTFILVERHDKLQTLTGVLQDTAEVLLVPATAALVEAKNVDHLVRGEVGFVFKPLADVQQVLRQLLQADQPQIYLAFDRSDRGEYSSWLWAGMLAQLSKGSLSCRRLHLAGLDARSFAKARELVEPIDSGQAACFYFEECFQRCLSGHLERLVGTRRGPGGVPLTTAAIAVFSLLAERDQEIRAHARKPKWQIELSLQAGDRVLEARLQEIFGVCCDGNLADSQQAKEVGEDLSGQRFRVSDRQENDLEIAAPPPYGLAELIFDAWRYCQVPMAEALQAATDLFSGVELAGRRQPLISSLHPVADKNMEPLLAAVQEHVAATFGESVLQARALAEYGILPLQPAISPDDVSDLPASVQKVYGLVWQRALASQMAGARVKEVIAHFSTDKYQVRSDYRLVETDGFLAVYGHGFDNLLTGPQDQIVAKGDQVTVSQVVPLQSSGLMPDLYTLPSLIDDLVELGVERQDEVIALVARLCQHGYIMARGDGTLQCDSNLFKVVNTLNRAMPTMQGMNFIVYYAQTLDEVVSGRKRFQMALKQFDQNLVIHGQPLVKAKMPTTLPSRTKTSKSIIKGDALPAKKKEMPVSQAEAAFTDFSQPPQPDQEAPSQEVAEETLGPAEPAVDQEVEESAASLQAADLEPEQMPADEAPHPAVVEESRPAAHAPEEAAESTQERAPLAGDDTVVLAAEGEEAEQDAESEIVATAGDSQAEPVGQPPDAQSSPEQEKAGPEPQRDKAPEVATKPCPECGRPMVLKSDRFGGYWACTGAPACRHTQNAGPAQDEEAGSCPLCQQGRLVVKRTPTGKNMYVCPRQDCEFMAWSKPHAIHCPLCSSPYLVEKKSSRSAGLVLRCPKAGCHYTQGMAGGEEAQAAPPKRKKVLVRRRKGSPSSGKRKVVVRRRKA